MRAAVITRTGPPEVVEVRDIDKPVPKPNEILVRIHYSTVCAADYRIRSLPRLVGAVMGLSKGKVLGMEYSGTVEAVGAGVTRLRVSDEVFGGTGFRFGTHAEYVCVPETGPELKPANMTMEEAAAVLFGGMTALCFLRQAKIEAGQNVLVYGASGSVGVFAVQLLKHWGARVTAVCSTPNVEMVRSLGADRVLDYTREDFSQDGPVYDVIVDTVGYAGIARTLRALKKGGIIVGIGAGGKTWPEVAASILRAVVAEMWIRATRRAKLIGGITKRGPGDLAFLKNLIEAGELRTVIDRRYPLAQIAEAHRYAQTGHKRGHVVIQIAA